MSEILKTNSSFDEAFQEIDKRIHNLAAPDNFRFIYDCSIRFANQYGIGAQFIEKIYLLGFIDGAEKGSNKHIVD